MKELIIRILDAEDARQIVVPLTENGSSILLKKRESIIASATALLEKLGKKDTLNLLRIQKKILDNA